jgi:response regulator NasT
VDPRLSILVIDENRDRARLIETSLRDAGHGRVHAIHEMRALLKQIEEFSPDVIVIDLENPHRDVLEHMFLVSRTVQRPIAMFVDKSDEQSMYRAIEAGVSAYVVDGLKKDRIKPILDLAVIRFRAFEKLRAERDEATQALAERKVVDRARGILMAQQELNELDAYQMLRRMAMNRRMSIADVAREIVARSEEAENQ